MSDIRYKHTRVFQSNWFDDLSWVKPGAKCVLVGRHSDFAPWCKVDYSLQRGENGVPGNADWSCKEYHGFRGSTDNVSKYAYGLREILSVSVLADNEDDFNGRKLRVFSPHTRG